eukprot:gnl/TRDRNA2_/TRDRNA2_175851_c0_seq3.p1 gnl/TRDRNA2_/TRDRNA2_175851_c0~~gnl/TRDRNA2_/TRDRNA2_175851_c0_seq3.p1  ORF type:complete len:192 (-),score=32.12 gnl/TRDRNA2_/TRDRNA2_175851_c0_seq3:64-639(-)
MSEEEFKCGLGVENCRIIENKSIKDPRGQLVPWDKPLVPFNMTRLNYIYDVPTGVERGKHAHTKIYELCICVKGSMTVTVEDGTGVKDMFIDSPDKGALICPNTWILLHNFAEGSCLSVLCSGEYDPKEVIRSPEAFEERFMHGAKLQTNDPKYCEKYNELVLEAKNGYTHTLCRSSKRNGEPDSKKRKVS